MNWADSRVVVYPILVGLLAAAIITNWLYYRHYRREPAVLLTGLVFACDFIAWFVRALYVGDRISAAMVVDALSICAIGLLLALVFYLCRVWYLLRKRN